MVLGVLICTFATGAAGASDAAAEQLDAARDTSVVRWLPDTNFGESALLRRRPRGGAYALLGFDSEALTDVAVGRQLLSARIELYLAAAWLRRPSTVKLHRLMGREWVEGTGRWAGWRRDGGPMRRGASIRPIDAGA